jgi:hypothetical protein
MSSCPTCKDPCDSIRSVVRQGKILTGCDRCLTQQTQKGDSAAFYRRAQQVQYRKDLVQPNQTSYAKAYPEDFRKRYGDEAYRRLG